MEKRTAKRSMKSIVVFLLNFLAWNKNYNDIGKLIMSLESSSMLPRNYLPTFKKLNSNC